MGEVVLDPGQWPVLLEDICAATGTTGAALVHREVFDRADCQIADITVTPSATVLFKNYLPLSRQTLDPRAVRSAILFAEGRNAVTDSDIFASEREMMDHQVSKERSLLGFKWWASIGFYAGSSRWGIALQRVPREGVFDKLEVQALAQLSGRLTEMAALSKAVGRRSLLDATGVLHRMNYPAIALDRLGSVIESNALAESIFDNEFGVKSGRLFASDAAARASLDRLADQLRASNDMEALPSSPIVVRRTDRQPVVIRVLPVDGLARNPFLGARVILILGDLEKKRAPDADLLLRTFNLTPAEARLAALMATGVSPEMAAETLGVSRETVRNQLKAVFAKTGTHRQGELVALLSRL